MSPCHRTSHPTARQAPEHATRFNHVARVKLRCTTRIPMPDLVDDPVLAPAVTPRKSRISWIWLVPLIAALAGASLVLRTWMESGPRITIAFNTAADLEVGKTQVRYKDVVVGVVNGIRLSEDWSKVIVTADITR